MKPGGGLFIGHERLRIPNSSFLRLTLEHRRPRPHRLEQYVRDPASQRCRHQPVAPSKE